MEIFEATSSLWKGRGSTYPATDIFVENLIQNNFYLKDYLL